MAGPGDQGDLSAAELFREHGAFVARFLFRLGVPADAIQDTVQEVFLVVHQRGGYRRGAAKPTSYLAIIATNAAAAQRRKARVQASRIDGAQPDELGAHGADPELTLETRDALRRLQAALDKLDPDLRTTLLLADGEDETCVSIANAMGVPVGTVYWRLHEARKRFQRALAAVDASNAPRPAPSRAARGRAATPAPVFARAARMLTFVFGAILPSWWRGSEAHALLRETAKQMPVPYDLQAGLDRHAEEVARLQTMPPSVALPPQANPGLLGSTSTTSALKVGLLVTAGGAALVAAIQLLPGPHAAPAVATAAPALVQVPAPRALSAPDALAMVRTESAVLTDGTNAAPVRDAPLRTRDGDAKSAPIKTRISARASSARSHGPARSSNEAEPTVSTPEENEPVAEAPKEQPPPAPPVENVVEAQALGRAERLLRTDPAQALALARKVALHGQSDYLMEERQYIEVMALSALDERRAAKRAADAFLAAYPQSVFSERVRRARAGTDDDR